MAPRGATFRLTWGARMSISEISLQILPGGIELDRRAGEIRKEGLKISLPEQLFRLLVLLMDHTGEVVTREEIRNNLWSDSFVNFDDSINSAIKRLRQCLDDSAENPRFIETLPGYGHLLPSAHRRRPAAYEAYLKAHYVFKNFTDEGLWKARHYWKKAVHEDPDYAKAYAGLAESYNMLTITGALPVTDALAQSREAAKKALELDDSLSEAHASLGFTHMLEWDWASAGREFKRALQLDPNLITGNPCHYIEYLMAVGRSAEAITEVERGVGFT